MDRKIVYLVLFLFCAVVAICHAQSTITEDVTSWYKVITNIEDSGAAALAMIIERSGPSTSIQQIKNQLPIIYDFQDIIGIMNVYDIKFRYINKMSDWDENGILLVLLNPEGFAPYEYSGNHYVIITGLHEDYYIVNDSLLGISQRYYKQFDINNARYWYIIQIY